MKRIIILCLLVGFVTIGVFANPLARIYQVDDPLWYQIEELSWESGINPFIASGPISGYELNRHLQKIDPAKLSRKGRAQLNEVIETINDPYNGKVFDYEITAALEGTMNTNEDFKYYDWAEGYVQRTPPLRIEAETIFTDGGYGIFSYALQKDFNENDFTGTKLNLPDWFGTGNSAFQNSLPHTAFLGYSSEWFTLVAGRDATRLGRGNSGNLMLNDNGPYNDFISLSFANKSLKYTFLAVPMNELITQEIIDANNYSGELGEAWYPHNTPSGYFHNLFYGTRRRTYIAHRLAIDFTPAWRVALTEGVLFYTDTYDLRMFNPVMLLHNLQNFGEVNNSIGLESEITLSKNWALNIQILADQIQTKGEQGSEELPPNAYAFLLGGRFSYPLNDWKLSGYVEGVYTSPWVYLRTGDQTGNYDLKCSKKAETQYNLDFVNAVTMYDGKSGVSWLGYPDGPDSIIFNTRLDAHYQDWLSFFGSIKAKVSGDNGLEVWGKTQKVVEQEPDDINMPSPTGGNPTYELTLGLGGSVRLFDTNITLALRNYVVNRWKGSSYGVDNQLTFGISYTF